MKYPLSWIKEFVDISLPVQELADKLSLAGLEVEAITTLNPDICHIITGHIQKIEKHPNADKLNVTWVSDGKNIHQIVCGAKNIYEGAIVPVSLPGAKLPNGLVITQTKLRGVDSCGMICSKSELGLTDDSEGIWILPQDTPIGIDFVEFATLKDHILEIKVLPNRGDCQSIYGLAREISVLLNTPLKPPTTSVTLSDLPLTQTLTVTSPDQCPLYTARPIHLSQSMPQTPLWMVRRLNLCLTRSINLIVDITNYVLLELGQPLHAFDATPLQNLTIGYATDTDTCLALDGNEYLLTPAMLVIKDATGVQAIAGVMGAKQSETTQDTTQILLESAYFDAVTVRKTANALSLRTESAIRFEKGVTITTVETASNRASHLIQTLTGAKIGPLTLQKSQNDPRFIPKTIPFTSGAINQLLGTSIPETTMVQLLNALEITLSNGTATIPMHRSHDLQELPCLAEEIARLIGYDHIPSLLPATPLPQTKDSSLTQLTPKMSAFMQAHGFNECITFTMISPTDIQKCNFPTHNLQEISNPISIEESIMRPSLLPSLLKVLSHTLNRQQDSVKLYEIGSQWDGDTQETWLTALTTGHTLDAPYDETQKTQTQSHFLTLKGLVESLFSAHRFPIQFTPSTQKIDQLHPSLQLSIVSPPDMQLIGAFGQIHPALAKKYDITQPIGYIAVNLTKLLTCPTLPTRYQEISKFPSTRRDVALIADKSLPYADIQTVITTHLPTHVQRYFVCDVFESDKLGLNKKSIAIAFIYQALDRSLTDDEVTKAHHTLCEILTSNLPVTIRD